MTNVLVVEPLVNPELLAIMKNLVEEQMIVELPCLGCQRVAYSYWVDQEAYKERAIYCTDCVQLLQPQ